MGTICLNLAISLIVLLILFACNRVMIDLRQLSVQDISFSLSKQLI